MTIRLSTVSSGTNSGTGDSSPLPEGRYDFQVQSVEFGVSPNKGTKQLTVWTKVAGGTFNGKTRLMNFYLTDKALWKLQSFLVACEYSKAQSDIEEEDLISDLETLKPTFSGYAVPNGEYNDFKNFDTATAAVTVPPTEKETSDLPFDEPEKGQKEKDYDDIPF